nr:hypothetical protein [Tanacetum cinerariifolium]
MIAMQTSGSGNTFLLAVAFFFRQWEVPFGSGNFLTSSGNALCILFPTLTLLKSIPQRINETHCDPEEEIRLIKRLLYENSSPHPPEEFISENSNTAFESFSLFPIPVEHSDSLMEEIDLSFTLDEPINDSLSLPENESFHFDIPSSSRAPAKPPDGNSGILNVKVMGDISKHKVPMLRLMITQPTLVPNKEKSPNLLSYLGHEAF